MYNHNLYADQLRERQDFYVQQGRIDRLAREARRAARAERRAAGRPAAGRKIIDLDTADQGGSTGQAFRPRWQFSRWAFHGPAH